MNGGLTIYDLDRMKEKEKRLDAAVEWLEGRVDSEKLITLQDILLGRSAQEPVRQLSPSNPVEKQEILRSSR